MYGEKLSKSISAVKTMAEKIEYIDGKHFLYYMDIFGWDMNVYSKKIEIPLNTIIKWTDENPEAIGSLGFKIYFNQSEDNLMAKDKIVTFDYVTGKNGKIITRINWKNYYFRKNKFIELLGNKVGEFYSVYLTEYIRKRKSDLEFFQQNFPAFFKSV